MSNTSHIVALTFEDFMDGFDPENFLESEGLEIMGDTFETGYVFREQLNMVISPYLPPDLITHLTGHGDRTFGHPVLHHLTLLAEPEGASVIGLTAEMLAHLQAGVSHALSEAEWGLDDNYEWEQFRRSVAVGDAYALIEFG